ncbi:guanylyl cyclase-activating protein 2-like [Corythoichthys intestinalis]|uniref:guanylyl cyclase-activating protein 2-like n=1 Tax=Corythoichthys intestinalis TaxID=161448 RepID=UPI0025A521BE|nr:guanylyl cyclase-activating protein 2-like [Corythoichthys intestinalis]XP_061811208.1 guanylyl cyclase-activating protein 2-like [Nerophis lumbriciformis]
MILYKTMGQTQSATDKEVALKNIQELYRRFADECPSGNLHLHEFKKIFGVNRKSSEEESAYMENVFRSFDTNKDGKLDFMEYVAAIHLVLRGKLEDKLKWSFKVYDRDGNGCLEKEEVGHILKIIYKLKKHSDPSTTENIEDICDRIFSILDKNDDSQISLEEFMEGAEKDPWVLEQLRLDFAACEWFLEHKKNPNS